MRSVSSCLESDYCPTQGVCLCGSLCDLCASVVTIFFANFTTETPRATEAHGEGVSCYTFIVEPACPRCHFAVICERDRLNPLPVLSPLMLGTACRDIHS